MSLPEYVVANLTTKNTPEMLRKIAEPLKFPLSEQDLVDLDTLSRKYDSEGSIAGLAAPQIGISKRFIVFATPEDPSLAIWRPDLLDKMPKTIWINPSFVGVEVDGYHEDYEGCFSVEGVAGLVSRFKTIHYEAYSVNGEHISGTVHGYLARIIQHEIDHLNGTLFSDMAKSIITRDEYKTLREEALARGYR